MRNVLRYKIHWINAGKKRRPEHVVFGEVLGQRWDRSHDRQTFQHLVETLSLKDNHYGRILDVGCGPLGRAEVQLARDYRIVGLDISPASARKAHEVAGNADFVAADVEYLPFRREVFSTVLCIGTICHLPNKRALLNSLRDMYRVLKWCGTAYLPWWMNALSLTAIERKIAMYILDLIHVEHAQYLSFNGQSEVEGIFKQTGLFMQSFVYYEFMEYPWAFYKLPHFLKKSIYEIVNRINVCLRRHPWISYFSCSSNVIARKLHQRTTFSSL